MSRKQIQTLMTENDSQIVDGRTPDMRRLMARTENYLMATPPSVRRRRKTLVIAKSSPYHYVDYLIGQWYQWGWGGEEKKNQGVVWAERAAHKGNTRAMFNLGAMYENGELGPKDNPCILLHSRTRFLWSYRYIRLVGLVGTPVLCRDH